MLNPEPEGPVEVWEENQGIVSVFTHCRFPVTVVAGMGGGQVLYQHIPASEIRDAAEILGVPREQWRELLWGVRVMEAAVLPELNRRR